MEAITLKINQVIRFLRKDIWRIKTEALSARKAWAVKYLRILLIALRGFDENQCALRASSLTYFTVLSVVPTMAMVFGLAKGFGLEDRLENIFMREFQGQKEVLAWILDFSQRTLDNTKGSLVAGVGFFFLIYTVMKLINSIEESFNAIWEIKKARSWTRKFTDYTTMMIAGPILVIVSGSATVYINSQFVNTLEMLNLPGFLDNLIMLFSEVFPFLFIWLLLSLLYLIMPNTRVEVRSAIIAGAFAGFIYHSTQWAYITFQIGVSKANALYGSFAAFPLFLVWLQLSWLIILLGAEVAFALQHEDKYQDDTSSRLISHYQRRLLGTMLVHQVVQRMMASEPPYSAAELALLAGLPITVVKRLLDKLVATHVLAETTWEDPDITRYLPAQHPDKLDLAYVVDKIDHFGNNQAIAENFNKPQQLEKNFQQFAELIRNAPGNRLLKDL
jgi:membrane protein